MRRCNMTEVVLGPNCWHFWNSPSFPTALSELSSLVCREDPWQHQFFRNLDFQLIILSDLWSWSVMTTDLTIVLCTQRCQGLRSVSTENPVLKEKLESFIFEHEKTVTWKCNLKSKSKWQSVAGRSTEVITPRTKSGILEFPQGPACLRSIF